MFFLDHMPFFFFFQFLTMCWLIWWLMIDDWRYDMITLRFNGYTVNGDNSKDNIGQTQSSIYHRRSWFYGFVKESLGCWWGTDDHETILGEALRDVPGPSISLLLAWSGLVWSGLVWSICIMTQGIIRITCEPIVPLCHWIKSAPWSKREYSPISNLHTFLRAASAPPGTLYEYVHPRVRLSVFFTKRPAVCRHGHRND